MKISVREALETGVSFECPDCEAELAFRVKPKAGKAVIFCHGCLHSEMVENPEERMVETYEGDKKRLYE